MTVSNGLSLTTLNSEEFTLCSGSFEWGVNCQIYPGKSENLNSGTFRCAHQKGLLALQRPMSGDFNA